MVDLILASVRDLPIPDRDTPLLVAELERRGVSCEVRPWGAGTDWSAAPAVLVRSTWDYFERAGEFLDWISSTASVTRLLNHPEVLAWNAHKHYLLDLADVAPTVAESEVAALALAAVPHPPTYARVDLVEVDGAPRVMELELIEPELFLYRSESAAALFADQLVAVLRA